MGIINLIQKNVNNTKVQEVLIDKPDHSAAVKCYLIQGDCKETNITHPQLRYVTVVKEPALAMFMSADNKYKSYLNSEVIIIAVDEHLNDYKYYFRELLKHVMEI